MKFERLAALAIAVCGMTFYGCSPGSGPQPNNPSGADGGTGGGVTTPNVQGMEEVAPGAKRKILHKKGLEDVQGREAVLSYVEYSPGAKSGKHTHAGPELVYVLSGSVKIEREGEEARVISAGDTYFGKAKVVHNVVNESKSETAKFLSYLLNEEGQMLAIPVKDK